MNWNDTLFDGLRKVNHNLHNGFALTPRAELLLTRMESCLCSGDGLSPRTAFRAADGTVAERTLELLGVCGSVLGSRQEDGLTVVSLGRNPWGIGRLYFSTGGDAATVRIAGETSR
ncbi:MAG: hypothetical protein II518_05775 [Candidatus Methanomethylophilus sp.]|jgi:hypothetical protein|nr:hypothetical protein [Methanomethylophilus sp.]